MKSNAEEISGIYQDQVLLAMNYNIKNKNYKKN
jgi:hypothetical protein